MPVIILAYVTIIVAVAIGWAMNLSSLIDAIHGPIDLSNYRITGSTASYSKGS